ncbi:protein of unknown function [Taphrina deformans PYCC 5710]|uniref:C2 domain protein n=1 Tax=Taphrina deformans (strain PYCC 5710 / ATCC 11124 / CBS 356.35 / IMI 108563 / JCM 9778 / NBRC 8474) TaxID=1097556 RepID=R4XDG0_TAPDE|nr:protein of unknown function [Taphrina deformans PYCC 5710]|eukprot:CCG83916.1 protein of unknown function [Taphrina deformans PYCC 5710]
MAEASGDGYSRNPEHEHKHGEQYSGRKKIPTVQRFNEQERQKREEADRQERDSKRRGLSRVVRDPITGGKVQIKDSSGDYKESANDMNITVPRRNVVGSSAEGMKPTDFNCEGAHLSELHEDPESDQHDLPFGKFLGRKTSRAARRTSQDPPRNIQSQKRDEKQRQRDDDGHTAANDEDGWVDLPMRGQRSNLMFYTLPDPDFDQHHDNVMQWFLKLPLFIFASECFRYFVIDFGRLTAICCYLAAGYWIKEQMELSWNNTKLDTVKRRADQALAKRVPESVEWLNALVHAVWKQINPDIFTAAIDKLEDIMQASAPSIIHAVKVDDLGHGDHPVRILSMRYLDDKEIDEDENHNAEDQHPGDFVNVEVSAAYCATESSCSAASKVKNMHLLIIFYGGLANVLGVPLPIWTEIQGFLVTLRLRMQFTPEFPYIKNTTFSLMGLPKFSISVVPISQRLINISNLPIISTFVEKSIKAALNEYVAPKSYTIDLGQLIAEDDVARETKAIGVVVVHIHRAEGLEAQDSGGKSDPYVVVSMSNYGKPIFSSRIIEKTLNPVFQETCFVLVTPESLRSRERLSLQIWDSDKVTADDELGRVEFDLQDLVRNSGNIEERTDGLVSTIQGKRMSGKLVWSVGYFSKRRSNPELATDGSDPNLAEDIKSHPDVKNRRALPDSKLAKAVTYCSPDPAWPSGILHIQIHQAIDLFADIPKSSHESGMYNKQGQDTTLPEVEEDEAQSPSSYCNIMMNDLTIYRTRTKPFSNKPYFNAGTERFVRDWRTAVCLISVRDSRTREHDALLGVVPLKLSEVFKNGSQVSKNYPIIGGVGQAKLKISLLWESIDYRLPKKMLGWDIGNFRIISNRMRVVDIRGEGRQLKNMRLKIHTAAASMTLGRRHCRGGHDDFYWDTSESGMEHFEIPCVRRHSTAVCIEFHSSSRLHAYAIATYWLDSLLDSDAQTLRLDIWRTDSDEKRCQIRQNKPRNQELGHEGVEKLGHFEFDAVFLRGLGTSHEKDVRTNVHLRQAHEAWQAAITHGKRERGDTYLVGRKGDKTPELNRPDLYSQLNDSTRKAKAEDSAHNDHFRSRENEAVDEEGRETVDASAKIVADVSDEHQRGGTEVSFANGAHNAHSSGKTNFDSGARKGEHHDGTTVDDNKHFGRSESRNSMQAPLWDEAWLQHNNLGMPVKSDDNDDEDEDEDDYYNGEKYRRGSITPTAAKRQSAMFSESDISEVSIDTSHAYDEDGPGNKMTKRQMRKAEKQQLHRQQRGSQQFKPFRTLKWAKDGVILGKAKVMGKLMGSQMRTPDVESEV